MNLLALQYLLSLICIIVVGVTAFNRNPNEPLNRSYSLLCVLLSVWVLNQFGLAISRTFEEARIWEWLHAEWPLGIVVCVHFVLLFTENRRILKPIWMRGIIYGPALVFCVLELTVDLFFSAPTKHTVGWIAGKPTVGPLSIIALAWVIASLLSLVFLVARYALTVSDRQKRNQARIFLLGLSISVVVTSFDAFVAVLSIKGVPSMNPIALACGAVFVSYAMWKYKMFSLTPTTAADSIISTMTDMLFLINLRGRILTANRAAYSILGYEEDELIGRLADSLFSPKVKWLHDVVSAEHGSSQNVTDIEVSFLTAEGRPIPASLSGTVIRDADHDIKGFLLIGRDITVRKKTEFERAELEAKYQQAQKLESIGRLAGGVAHDINNVLGAIMVSTAVLKEEIEPDSVSTECIQNVLSGCRRGRDLTQNLLGFARKGKYNKRCIPLNDVIEETTAILSRTIPKRITIKNQLDPQLGSILGDKSQIQNVFMNVVINAADSIKGAGELNIETSNTYLDESACSKLGNLRPGDYVRLTVIDNGRGMDSATQAKAFEPFFTTKAKGKGTGLGLSMAYGVIVNHDGIIKVDSEVGKGTVVTIYLPILDAETQRILSQTVSEDETGPAKKKRHTDRSVILLVDDEPLFQSSTRKLLKKMGHTVYVAENGRVAVDIYRMYHDTISLVLLDMLMPGMDGPETFIKLKEINPAVNILIMSGFDKDENVEKLLTQGACGYVQKPFDMETLSDELAAALP